MSSHVGEAAASPSPPEGLDKRQERFRKRSLKRLKRKANGCSLETAMAYLSHAKDTASLRHLARLLWRGNPEHRPEIYSWLGQHRPGRYSAGVE